MNFWNSNDRDERVLQDMRRYVFDGTPGSKGYLDSEQVYRAVRALFPSAHIGVHRELGGNRLEIWCGGVRVEEVLFKMYIQRAPDGVRWLCVPEKGFDAGSWIEAQYGTLNDLRGRLTDIRATMLLSVERVATQCGHNQRDDDV